MLRIAALRTLVQLPARGHPLDCARSSRALLPDHTILELDMTTTRWSSMLFSAVLLAAPAAMAAEQNAAAKLERESRAALEALYAKVPEARAFGKNATAILVFPKVTKA